jgi:hypothetical protein
MACAGSVIGEQPSGLESGRCGRASLRPAAPSGFCFWSDAMAAAFAGVSQAPRFSARGVPARAGRGAQDGGLPSRRRVRGPRDKAAWGVPKPAAALRTWRAMLNLRSTAVSAGG